MNEMLGNQYFISNRYKLAKDVYKKSLIDFPNNPCVKKKLILCNIKSNSIEEAFKLFNELVNENINCFFDEDFSIEECPCKQMIFEYETDREVVDSLEKHIVLSMLWLYRNIDESIKYLKLLRSFNYRVQDIDSLLVKLITHKKSNN